MSSIRFVVHKEGGKREELFTESAQVLIGTAAHCDVRLPSGSARAVHVAIDETPTGLRATARSIEPPPRIDGIEFADVAISAKAVLEIGRLRIDVEPVTGATKAAAAPKSPPGAQMRMGATLMAGLAGFAALMVVRSHGAQSSSAQPPPPALWASAAATCPQSEPAQAQALATSRVGLALVKRERSPFNPEDGIAAVPLYLTAEACFRAAGRDAEAHEAATSAARVRQSMSEAFAEHRVRLDRALTQKEWTSAQHESAVLSSFVGNVGGAYSEWLSNLSRRLQLTYGGKTGQ